MVNKTSRRKSMDQKSLIIICVSAIICVTILSATALILNIDNQISNDNNTTNDTNITLNDSNNTNNTSINQTTKKSTTTKKSSSKSSSSNIESESIKENYQAGDGSHYREVKYKDGNIRQYDKNGKLIGSSYQSDQAQLKRDAGDSWPGD